MLAADLAAQAQAPDLMLLSVRMMRASFEFDELAVERKLLDAYSKKVADAGQLSALVAAVADHARACLARDRHNEALACLQAAGLVCRKLGDRDHVQRLGDLHRSAKRAQALWQEVAVLQAALAEKPDEPAANLALGRWWAEHHGDWQRAMPYLAKSGEPVLQRIAQTAIRPDADADEWASAGEAWSELVSQEGLNASPDFARHQAAIAFERALAMEADDLQRSKITQRRAKALGLPLGPPPVPTPPSGASTLLTFEPNTCARRDDKVFVARDLTDAVGNLSAEHLQNVPKGKVGQAVRFGEGWASLGRHQFAMAREGSLATWAYFEPIKGEWRSYLYSEWAEFPFFEVFVNDKRQFVVQSWHPNHDWTVAATPEGSVPQKQWTFLAFSLFDATDAGGTVRMHVDEKVWEQPLRMCGHGAPREAKIIATPGSMLDEYLLNARALSSKEIESIYELGLAGQGFGREP
jgi:hypothetical protein